MLTQLQSASGPEGAVSAQRKAGKPQHGGMSVKIQILELIEGAKKAEGLTVIIDVFRAFTTECYCFAGGAAACYPIGALEDAFALKRQHPDWVLLGERGGAKVEGCDLGNSPWDAVNYDFRHKTMIHTTGAGTQGIVNAAKAGASQIVTGSLVNAKAVCAYIRSQDPETVSLTAMGIAGTKSAPEDLLAANYMKALLEGADFDIDGKIAYLKDHGGEQFFDPKLAHIFPREDYPLCVAVDRFDFVLRVEKEEEALVIRKTEIGRNT